MCSVSGVGFNYEMMLPPTDVDGIDVLCDFSVNQQVSRCEAEMTAYPVRVDFCVGAICLDGWISVYMLSDEPDCRIQATRANCGHLVCYVVDITTAGVSQSRKHGPEQCRLRLGIDEDVLATPRSEGCQSV
jgi:hypothetical protein